MVIMTGEKRKVADFLTEKKFKWKFQPSISVIDTEDGLRPFISDFYLIDLGIYIDVYGAERNRHHNRKREIYKKNKVPIIDVETYMNENDWKKNILRRIKEIQEKR